MTIGAPPQSARPERASRRGTVAFSLVGPDSPSPERDWHHKAARTEPTPALIACDSANPDSGKRPISRAHPARSWNNMGFHGIIIYPADCRIIDDALFQGITGHSSHRVRILG